MDSDNLCVLYITVSKASEKLVNHQFLTLSVPPYGEAGSLKL